MLWRDFQVIILLYAINIHTYTYTYTYTHILLDHGQDHFFIIRIAFIVNLLFHNPNWVTFANHWSENICRRQTWSIRSRIWFISVFQSSPQIPRKEPDIKEAPYFFLDYEVLTISISILSRLFLFFLQKIARHYCFFSVSLFTSQW